MSILSQISSAGEWVYLLLGAAVAALVLWRARPWEWGRIAGPARVPAEASPLVLGAIPFAALGCWILTTAVVLVVMEGPSAATRPSQIPPVTLIVAQLVGQATSLALLLLANLVFRPGGLALLGLGRDRPVWRAAVAGTLVALPAVSWVAVGTVLLWRAIDYEHPSSHELLKIMQESGPALRWGAILSAVLVAPLFEELLFRGHLQTFLVRLMAVRPAGSPPVLAAIPVPPQPGTGMPPPLPAPDPAAAMPPPPPGAPPVLSQATPSMLAGPPGPPVTSPARRWAAVLTTALIFALIHPLWTAPPIFVLAVCLGYVYERTGSLWAVIIMHAAFNATQVAMALAT